MHIHLCQHRIVAGSAHANRARVRELVMAQSLAKPGLLMLPEIFSTGVLPTEEAAALKSIGASDRAFLIALAQESGLWVLGTTADGGPGSLHNLSLLYDDQGKPRAAYRKMHPFSFAGEHLTFAAGNDVVVAEMHGFQTQLSLCYDLRFPELYRAGVDMGAELITVQANWPVNRQMHWDILLRARAIENQAYVAGVNCVGQIGQAKMVGGSLIASPRGDILVQAGEGEGIYSALIDADMQRSWRRAFPALRDRRPSHFFKNACG
jgi:omega-amidase